MRHSRMKRLSSFLMAVVMVLTLGFTGPRAAATEESGITVERLDPSDVSANLFNAGSVIDESTTDNFYADTDMVRVMIVLEEAPAISIMSTVGEKLSNNADVAAYRDRLLAKQNNVAGAIAAALGTRTLDVQWNLTLVTNAISANVQFGQIDTIKRVAGVKAVYLEIQHMPLKADVSNIVSQEMTGASAVQNSGYTGAGSRIAVVDTGTDTDHQSFSGAAFEYSLAELAEKNNMSFDEYVDYLNLLTVEEVASVLDQLHIYERSNGTITAEQLYINSKLPFNFNYIDMNTSMDHTDNNNEHGSHVAGISTANRYIDCTKVYDFDGNGAFDAQDISAVSNFIASGGSIANVDYADLSGNGSVTTYDLHLLLDALADQEENGAHYISAYDSVRVTGVAPDAQLLTMKVFGASGGAYSTDYMAAVEDAIVLGCDVVNLSLGAPYPGFNASYGAETSAFVNDIMATVAESGIVMSVAAGNSGHWATYSENGVGMMYTDEAGTYTTGEPATYEDTLSIASADNVTSFAALTVSFFGANGEKIVVSPYSAVLDENYTLSSWVSLDEIDPEYAASEYELVFLGDPTELFTGLTQTDETIYAGAPSDFDGFDFTGKIVLVARGTYNFFDKHNHAAMAGAAGVVIYNNVPGQIQPNISGTNYPNVPCMGISFEEALALYKTFERNDEGLFAGKLSVRKALDVDMDADFTDGEMSSFSSWGTTGDLRIKPEITAPGGGIYSVNGLGTSGDQYELMSGTSMAAPHLSGLTALLTQYFRENDILDKVDVSGRVLAHSLLMSTAKPLIEDATGLEFSIRNQGAGLANIQNAINSHAYIMVKGQDDGKVKAELGEGTHDRVIEFTINNFGDSALTYDLSASLLTTGTVMDQYGSTYSTPGMTTLPGTVTFSADTVTVPAGESVSVTATISISEETAAEMEAIGYVNGFYVEGYLYINAVADSEGVMDASHSIPLLGWYGSWADPSMFDSNTFMDFAYNTMERASHIMYPTKNILAWCPIGYGQGLYYTGNIYGGYDAENNIVSGDQRYIEARNAICTLPTAQWEIYAIFPTLIRNAGDFKLEVVDSVTGEVYYVDDYELYGDPTYDTMYGSFYYTNYGQWYDSTSDYGIGLGDWAYTDLNGDPLPDGTQFDINLICVPELYVKDGVVDWDTYEVTEGNVLTYSFTIDNTVPELVGDSLAYDAETGDLTFTVQDNNYVAAVILLNGSASAAIDYYYPDMDEDQRGQSVSGKLNLSSYAGQKVAIAVADYAGNESYYAINLGGEGASYGDLIGFQMDAEGYMGSWVAFDTNVNFNETGLFTGPADFICAEYVNGHVYAQDKTGKFYGIPYEAMLADSVNLEAFYLTTLENLYQDMAYSYATGELYGINTYEERGYPTTEVFSINLKGEHYDEYGEIVAAYQEDWVAGRGGVYALTFAIDDGGNMYLLGTVATETYDEESGEYITKYTETAHLWKSTTSGWGSYVSYIFSDIGDTGMEMDYLQSMTWDHNTETLYWARFYPVSWFDLRSELVKFNFTGDGFTTEILGQLSSETCALMAPLSEEAAAKAEHQNVPEFDAEVVAAPTLDTHTLSMGKGGTAQLSCTFDPWYSNHKDLIWTSSDESVATVDQNGKVTAIADGICTITVTNTADETKYDTCAITVASLSLDIEGIISYSSGGINSVGGSKLYQYSMNNGAAELKLGTLITAPDQFQGYGLSIGSAVYAKDSIWACEVGNAGIVYEIDPTTGVIRDMLSPINGHMTFGFSYSETTEMFTGIMNYFMFVDQPLTHDVEDDMLGSYDPETNQYTWHSIDMLKYLEASQGNFVTGENGQGASSEIVFCGITDIDNDGTTVISELNKDALNESMMASYAPTTTHVLLDNVGRLWYIDEVVNMTYDSDDQAYTDELGNMIMPYSEDNAVFSVTYEVDADTELHNVFVIRKIEETTLTDMFRAGTMPRITYHFSDIYYAGETEQGAPVFYLSLYDYWNEGSENLLYLYVGGIGTGKYEMDENWNRVEIMTDGMLFKLGGTGTGNIIASILKATPASEIKGLPAIELPEVEEYSVPRNAETFVSFYRVKTSVTPLAPVAPSVSVDHSNIAAFVNRLA
ncbi:MAG: S8 family serine peptidase [Oscillospiraceae bacterium]|nr:S8 family serine peptidase [Oscillospiraceae bacterium]